MADVNPVGMGHGRSTVEEVDQAQDQAGIGNGPGHCRQNRCPAFRMTVTDDQAEEVASYQPNHDPWKDSHQRIGKYQRRQRARWCHEGPHPGQEAPDTTDDGALSWPEGDCRNDDGNVKGRNAQWSQGNVTKERD